MYPSPFLLTILTFRSLLRIQDFPRERVKSGDQLLLFTEAQPG